MSQKISFGSIGGMSTVLLIGTLYVSSLVSASSEFFPHAQTLANAGVINTQSSEYGYRLSSTISRAEAVKLILGIVNISQNNCRNLSSFSFDDVSTSIGDLCGYIEGAVQKNIIASSVRFYPNIAITRGDFADIIVKGFDASSPGLIGNTVAGVVHYTDISSALPTASSINRLATTGCLNLNLTTFRPASSITRGEAFKMMACLLGKRNGVSQNPESGIQNQTSNTNNINTNTTNTQQTTLNSPQSSTSYIWSTTSYGSCSRTCGEGVQTRTVTCKRTTDNTIVADSFCIATGVVKPVTQKLCNTQSCGSGTSVSNNYIDNLPALPANPVNPKPESSCLEKNVVALTDGVLGNKAYMNSLTNERYLYARGNDGGDTFMVYHEPYPAHHTLIFPEKNPGSDVSFSIRIPIDWEKVKSSNSAPKSTRSIYPYSPGKKYALFIGLVSTGFGEKHYFSDFESLSLSLSPGDFSTAVPQHNEERLRDMSLLLVPIDGVDALYLNYRDSDFRYDKDASGNRVWPSVSTKPDHPYPIGLQFSPNRTVYFFTEEELKDTKSTFRLFGTGGKPGTLMTGGNPDYAKCAYDAVFSGNFSRLLPPGYSPSGTPAGPSGTPGTTPPVAPVPAPITTYGACSGTSYAWYSYRMPGSNFCYQASFKCSDGQLRYGTQFSPAPPVPPAGTRLFLGTKCE